MNIEQLKKHRYLSSPGAIIAEAQKRYSANPSHYSCGIGHMFGVPLKVYTDEEKAVLIKHTEIAGNVIAREVDAEILRNIDNAIM